MQRSKYFILSLNILIIISCKQNPTECSVKLNNTSDSGKLIPINYSDSNYYGLAGYTVDTITADGWSIKYFVKNDCTKYKDLYINCSRGNTKSTYCAENVLQLRRYFIPTFAGETKTNIYFTHGCATDCSALLVFRKDSTIRFDDYLEVVKYDFQLGQVLHVPDTTYNNDVNIYELELVDLNKQKKYKLTFHGACDASYKPACVDTVKFLKNEVFVEVDLRKNIEDTNRIKQTRIIHL